MSQPIKHLIQATAFIPRMDDGLLYHYTTIDSLLKILESMTLRMSSPARLNDLNELGVMEKMDDYSFDSIKVETYIKEHCRVLSFSRNYMIPELSESYVFNGANHPRMWAQYAKDNTGACLILDESELLSKNAEFIKSHSCVMDDVVYDYFPVRNSDVRYSTPSDYCKTRCKDFFFIKHKEWEHEGERRLVAFDTEGDEVYVSISECIASICLGARCSDEDYERLLDVVTDPMSKCYRQIHPEHITQQYNSQGHCSLMQDYRFDAALRKRKNNLTDYIQWLNADGCVYEI